MLELVNLANDAYETERLFADDTDALSPFLQKYHLDGVELILSAPWDGAYPSRDVVHGAHLFYWPVWLDLWLGNAKALELAFGSLATAYAYYGLTHAEIESCEKRTERESIAHARSLWVAHYRENFRLSAKTGAKYVVFHVADVRPWEIMSRQFQYTDEDVIDATIALVAELSDALPTDTLLLYENLWWPGLRMTKPALLDKLLSRTDHQTGVMLDTGHLMNSNLSITSQQEGIAYVREVLQNLGSLRHMIHGTHLHQSASAAYTRRMMRPENMPQELSVATITQYIMQVDQHAPYTDPAVRELVEEISPQFLIHEFLAKSKEDWENKLTLQLTTLHGE